MTTHEKPAKSALGKMGRRPKAPKKAADAHTPTGRNLAVNVHTAHKRTHSSTLWLERQLNDPYVAEAKKQGWRSRAAFKLLQIDDKFKLLRGGMKVVDLGAAPGGWTQVAVQKVKPERGKGKIVGIDLLEMEELAGAHLYVADFNEQATIDRLKEEMDGPVDLVMSDMAANTTGHAQTDHLRIMDLAEQAAIFAVDVLAPGGAFVCKIFQGGSQKETLNLLKKHFAVVKHTKPAASRADSSETYVVATGFRKTK